MKSEKVRFHRQKSIIIPSVPIIPSGTASKKHHGASPKTSEHQKSIKNRDRRIAFSAVVFSLVTAYQFLCLNRQKSFVIEVAFLYHRSIVHRFSLYQLLLYKVLEMGSENNVHLFNRSIDIALIHLMIEDFLMFAEVIFPTILFPINCGKNI